MTSLTETEVFTKISDVVKKYNENNVLDCPGYYYFLLKHNTKTRVAIPDSILFHD